MTTEFIEFTTLAGDDFAERQGGEYTPEGYAGDPDDDACVGITAEGVEAQSQEEAEEAEEDRFTFHWSSYCLCVELVCEGGRWEVGGLGSGLFAGDGVDGTLILDLVVEEPDEVAQALFGDLVEGAVACSTTGDALDDRGVFKLTFTAEVSAYRCHRPLAKLTDVAALGASVKLASQRCTYVDEVVRLHILRGGAAVG